MESNREESLKCLSLAEKYLRESNYEKAEKFAHKSEKLYPTERAKELFAKIAAAQQQESSSSSQDGPRQRFTSPNSNSSTTRRQSKGDDEPSETSESATGDFTPEQAAAVKKVRSCQDYYQILGVTKEASESELKKGYRKMALQFHPDKNKAPGAGEAFKAIGNAFATLSDSEKRRQYDLYGPEVASNNSSGHTRRHAGGRHGFAHHEFEADMSAEEIFNMFFGGGFPSQTVYTRRGGAGVHRGQRGAQQHRQFHHHNQEARETSGLAALIQLMPILLILFLSVCSTLFVSDPLYQLQQSQKYNIRRATSNLRVPYYVKDSFHTDFQGSIRRLESSIEEDYLSNLRQNCFREKSYKENLLWQARYSGNSNLLNRAHNYATPSCDQLEKLYSY